MKSNKKSTSASTALVVLWIIPGIIFLILTAIAIIRRPGFRLSLGLLHATGTAALVATLSLAAWGTVALLLLFRARPLGARLLLAYCLFWLVDFLGSLLVNWKDLSTNDVLTNGPTEAKIAVPLLMLAFLMAFALCAVWCWRRVRA